MDRPSPESRYNVSNLERGLQILELLDRNAQGLTIQEMVTSTGFPKNSIFRIAMTLLNHGWLDRHGETLRFRLSGKVLGLGYGALTELGLIEAALEGMRALRDQVRETVVLSVLKGNEGIVLEGVAGSYPFRFSADPGTRQPLHASASCKAILAFLPESERAAIGSAIRFEKFTPKTLLTLDQLEAELGRIRGDGYALDLGEHMEGVHCVAAPLFGPGRRPVASITVTGPVARMPMDLMQEMGPVTREAAGRISVRLGRGKGACHG